MKRILYIGCLFSALGITACDPVYTVRLLHANHTRHTLYLYHRDTAARWVLADTLSAGQQKLIGYHSGICMTPKKHLSLSGSAGPDTEYIAIDHPDSLYRFIADEPTSRGQTLCFHYRPKSLLRATRSRFPQP